MNQLTLVVESFNEQLDSDLLKLKGSLYIFLKLIPC